jgi:hypothetical protein
LSDCSQDPQFADDVCRCPACRAPHVTSPAQVPYGLRAHHRPGLPPMQEQPVHNRGANVVELTTRALQAGRAS